MSAKSDKFFSDEEKKLIEETIAEVEKKTSGEIVAMVVDQSNSYEDSEVVGSVLIAACLSVYPAEAFFMKSSYLLHKILPSVSWLSKAPDEVRFIAGLCAFIVFTMFLYMPLKSIAGRMKRMKRFFIREKRKQFEVKSRAIRAFHEHHLDATRDGTGILFMISLLEHKVYVLADHGIYAKISQTALDGYAFAVAAGVAEKRAASALCESIRTIGADLAQYFPAKPDDRNELKNSVISE